jgi:hypothetical protein
MPAPKTNKTNSQQEIIEEEVHPHNLLRFFRCGDDDGRCCISQPRRK